MRCVAFAFADRTDHHLSVHLAVRLIAPAGLWRHSYGYSTMRAVQWRSLPLHERNGCTALHCTALQRGERTELGSVGLFADGAAVKFSTNLASRHGTATIFASLSFCRALLHADGSRATFLLLGLPGDEGPIDHAQATYVFSEEAALLPCYLPQGTEHACELAALTREVARVCLNLNHG